MDDQKIENLLNLALDATERERKQSLELNVGFLPEGRRWELIVKHSGSLEAVKELSEDIRVTELLGDFGILIVPEALVEAVAGLPQIEYVEKPKRLFFAIRQAKAASCLTFLQTGREGLFGEGILMGIVDSGVDIRLPEFRSPDGKSRILYLQDQTLDQEFTKEELDAWLETGQGQPPGEDVSGHGTAVAAIAAGSTGVAPACGLLVVKLGQPLSDSFPRTTQLMTGVDFILRKAMELKQPAVVNLSFGMNYGSHLGDSLLEAYLNAASVTGRFSIVAGTGNEGAEKIHTSGSLRGKRYGEAVEIPLAVGTLETVLNLQIWKSYVDEMGIELIHPDGSSTGRLTRGGTPARYVLGSTELLTYYGEPSPYSSAQEIFIDFLPRETYVDSGIWRIRLTAEEIVDGEYQMWLPSGSVLNAGTGFLYPMPDNTITIPSTAANVVSVGAYNSLTDSYADFSGRGASDSGKKPDLVGPGVGIRVPQPGGGTAVVSGTSFATPFVSGGAALLMEWGIVRGNDPYLYGQKVKAYLQRGARELPGFVSFPNPQVGYGALCVAESLPG